MFQIISFIFLSVSILTTLSFINHSFLLYYYSFLFIYLIYTIITIKITPTNLSANIPEELKIIYKKYYIYFSFPNASIIKSRNLSFIGITTIVVGIYMSIFFVWYTIILSIIIFVITSKISPLFNPINFINRGKKVNYNYGPTKPDELDSILLISEILNKKHIIN